MPKRKVSSTQRVVKEEPKRRLLAKPAPTKVERKPEKVAAKDKSSDKKVQTKGKRGAKGKQAEVTNQRLKRIYLQKTEKLKIRRAQPLMKQERKKPSPINTTHTHPVPSVVPVPLLVQPRGVFLSTIL
uniref:Uncharacterized protein n=1 Tax=Sus scrofa TaxID=9823 RepID=A0A8D1D0B4_PIG